MRFWRDELVYRPTDSSLVRLTAAHEFALRDIGIRDRLNVAASCYARGPKIAMEGY